MLSHTHPIVTRVKHQYIYLHLLDSLKFLCFPDIHIVYENHVLNILLIPVGTKVRECGIVEIPVCVTAARIAVIIIIIIIIDALKSLNQEIDSIFLGKEIVCNFSSINIFLSVFLCFYALSIRRLFVWFNQVTAYFHDLF